MATASLGLAATKQAVLALLLVVAGVAVALYEDGCPTGRFRCGVDGDGDRRCIANEFVCDGESDCEDNADEDGCQTCSPRAYRCRGGQCRHPGVRCNRSRDCPDGSDEEGCPPQGEAGEARPDRYVCYANRTIDAEFHCDGYNTCDDGDEYNCGGACQAGGLYCGDACPLSFKCLKASTVCDGKRDYPFTKDEEGCAPDGPGSRSVLETTALLRRGSRVVRGRDWSWGDADGGGVGVVTQPVGLDGWLTVNWTTSGREQRVRMGNDTKYDLHLAAAANTTCPPDRFACDEGRCIHRDFVCDGLFTCADKTDEADCRWCSPRAFQCAPGGECRPRSQLCDGTNHCPFGRDEENCQNRILPQRQRFYCQADKNIIPESLVCNGLLDCTDGEDEAHCEHGRWYPTSSWSQSFAGCQGGALYCNDRSCVNPGLVCDGVPDCPDGDDEVDCAEAGAAKLRGPEAAARLRIGSVVVRGNDHWYSGLSFSVPPPEPARGVVRSRIDNYGYVSVFWPGGNKTQDHLMGAASENDKLEYYYDLHVLASESKQEACGLAARADGPLVLNGTPAPLGTFPWHAGLYLRKDTAYTGICGGSLVSPTVVVTAAHCLFGKSNVPLRADQLYVALGKFRSGWDDEKEGVHKSAVAEIIAHPTYKGPDGSFANDIALLRMADEILNFGRAIAPVCRDDGVGLQASEAMQIVGWGYGKELRPDLASVSMNFVPYSACVDHVRKESRRHLPWVTRDKICSVRHADLTFSAREGLARGDSGSGAVVQRGSAWFLVGVVSTSFINDTVYTFTDVEQFLPWIRQYTDRPEEKVPSTSEEKTPAAETEPPVAVTSPSTPTSTASTLGTKPASSTEKGAALSIDTEAIDRIVFPRSKRSKM